MTHSLLKALAARGHEVVVSVREGSAPWVWEGITVTGGSLPTGQFHALPEGDVCIYHSEYHEGSVDGWRGPKVGICHNSRIGVKLGIRNSRPDLLTLNSEIMRRELPFPRQIVVHPPVPDARPLHGDRITVINMEETNKIGPFWELARMMPDVEFLGVKGGYGKQSVARGRPRKNVKVIDPVPSDRMDEVWAQTRVLLVPSATESWSMVASEAMARGIPVIANPLPSLQENLQGVGLWAHRDNPHEWVNRIRFVLGAWDDYSAASMQRAREQKARHDFEVDMWCDAVEELCRR
jgi:hypothetical protein